MGQTVRDAVTVVVALLLVLSVRVSRTEEGGAEPVAPVGGLQAAPIHALLPADPAGPSTAKVPTAPCPRLPAAAESASERVPAIERLEEAVERARTRLIVRVPRIRDVGAVGSTTTCAALSRVLSGA